MLSTLESVAVSLRSPINAKDPIAKRQDPSEVVIDDSIGQCDGHSQTAAKRFKRSAPKDDRHFGRNCHSAAAPIQVSCSETCSSETEGTEESYMRFPPDFADSVAKLSCDHYQRKLPKTGKPKPDKEWTLLAAIVMSNSQLDKSSLRVAALATGTKCIGQSKMSPNGHVLNDSHAEVLARRCFLRFIYQQLNRSVDNDQTSIFRLDEHDGKFQLSPDVKFHLYTSATPCGDAAIFPAESSLVSACPRSDIHRTGAKCVPGAPQDDPRLPGDGYHVTGVLRTKPGRGERTLSMSCSDKIAKWNVLGLQGALLASILSDPIYLSSIIVGNGHCDFSSLCRAVVDRNRDIRNLSEGYRVSAPELLKSECEFVHSKDNMGQCSEPSNTAILFSDVAVANGPVEVSVNGYRQGATKKSICAGSARCAASRCELFREFLQLRRKLLDVCKDSTPCDVRLCTYKDSKDSSSRYQLAKVEFLKQYPGWTVKPAILMEFTIDVTTKSTL